MGNESWAKRQKQKSKIIPTAPQIELSNNVIIYCFLIEKNIISKMSELISIDFELKLGVQRLR